MLRPKLADAGITHVSCCLSCHDDADGGYDWEMCGIYEDDLVEGGLWDKLVGSVCCSVRNAFEIRNPRVLDLYRKADAADKK